MKKIYRRVKSKKWLGNIVEGIYLFENIEYDPEKGAFLKEAVRDSDRFIE